MTNNSNLDICTDTDTGAEHTYDQLPRRERDRETDRQTGKQADRQTGRQAVRQTDVHKQSHANAHIDLNDVVMVLLTLRVTKVNQRGRW